MLFAIDKGLDVLEPTHFPLFPERFALVSRTKAISTVSTRWRGTLQIRFSLEWMCATRAPRLGKGVCEFT
jgi:hypothetical protein